MPSPLPFMQIYHKELLIETRRLNLAERGLFWDMILFQWEEGWIPDDIEEIVSMAGQPRKDVEKAWTRVRSRLELIEPGKLAHIQIKQLRDAAIMQVAKNRENGKKGGRPKNPGVTQDEPNGFENDNPEETQTKPPGFNSANPKETETKAIPEPEPEPEPGDISIPPYPPKPNPWDGYPEGLRSQEFHELWLKYLSKRARQSGGKWTDPEEIEDALKIVAADHDPIDFVNEAIHGNWSNLYNFQKKREEDAKKRGLGRKSRPPAPSAEERFAHLRSGQ